MIRVLHQYISPKAVCLMLWEGLLMVLCFAAAAKFRFWGNPGKFTSYTALPSFGIQVLLTQIVLQSCFYYNELYDLQVVRSRREQMLRLYEALGAGCILLGFLSLLVPAMDVGSEILFINLVLLTVTTSLSRLTLDHAWRSSEPKQKILILGAGPLAVKVGREVTRRDDLRITLAGFLDRAQRGSEIDPSTLFGRPLWRELEELPQIVAQQGITRIIVALEEGRGALPVRSLVNLRTRGIPIEEAHTALAALTGRVWLELARPSWFVYSDGFCQSRRSLVLKRAVDLGLGLAGLLLTAPLMALIAMIVRLDSRGPALYRQERVGLGGRRFQVLKFRSMSVNAESAKGAQWAQVNDPRVTRVGRVLRKYRLDELPQFINVIRGEMSFVGPRPERPVFVDQLKEKIPYYEERHSVRPGITGWAQVQYPYGASIEDAVRKHEYDLFYMKNRSLLFDCAIVVQTVRTVLFGCGAR